jgi:hypothetical protein
VKIRGHSFGCVLFYLHANLKGLQDIHMWPNEKVRKDRSGRRWNFHYQYFGKGFGQRLFFWDEERQECGVLLFPAEATRRYAQIENLIDNLVADADLRKRHHRELKFPLDRHYSDFEVFPEERIFANRSKDS